MKQVRRAFMPDAPIREINLFYCYAREDKALRDELEKHLSWLKRRYQLKNWHDREILPGEEWEQAIDEHLNSAHIILLLISPDFMASDYCFGREMQRALERHREGTCRVIPILLRPTYWEEAPFSHLQLLPGEARCVTTWPNRDEAFREVVIGISRTIKDLLASLNTRETWLNEAERYYDLKRYEEALAALDEAILLDPGYARAYYNKSLVLHDLARYEEALSTCEQLIRLEPRDAKAYYHKSYILNSLNRYEEALAALEQALRLAPDYAPAYTSKGYVLNNMKRYEEALAAFEQGIRFNAEDDKAYHGKGVALYNLKHYEEAERAFEKVSQREQESQ
jgi:tetratricopeptide (TPR) repeat protein